MTPETATVVILGTKAETLTRLRPVVRTGIIEDLVCSTHARWSTDRAAVLAEIRRTLGQGTLIVRSSALAEDQWNQSQAGAFKTISNVDGGDQDAVAAAIEAVLTSYGRPAPLDQVLIQRMLGGVTMSGVVMTRTATRAPYLVINFDDTSSRTDRVTSGEGGGIRTVYLRRGAPPPPWLPRELVSLLRTIEELEQLVGHDALSIEFAFLDVDEPPHVLQVRPIAAREPPLPVDEDASARGLADAATVMAALGRARPFLVGEGLRLSVMSDWNPAEIVGVKPKPLALSLYRELITDEVWAQQRAELGYRDVRPCPLLVDILGCPYVDVRASFNSFVPAALGDELAGRLVDHYLARLADRPELHDKIEFEVAITCRDFAFERRAAELRAFGFSSAEVVALRDALTTLTHAGLGRVSGELRRLEPLRRRFEAIERYDVAPLDRAFLLLDDARRLGSPIFAHLARCAFIARSLLNSLETIGVTTPAQTDAFMLGLSTVATAITEDARATMKGTMRWEAFVTRYGHLRPGTYDITSPTYAAYSEEFLRPMLEAGEGKTVGTAAAWDATTRMRVQTEIDRIGLGLHVDAFVVLLRQAMEARELAKFVFTRNLSAALEALAELGADHGVSREDMAHIPIGALRALRGACARGRAPQLRELAATGREAYATTRAVCLPAQLTAITDLHGFEQPTAIPNFVTHRSVQGLVAELAPHALPGSDLAHKIVLISHADPGYDWLFSRDIGGLVTAYGGVNSHMAVRAAEFDLPSAIGVGEALYERIGRATLVELDCQAQCIRVVA